eukprot:6182045-Pleurochrysis_carterae.AAC.2
MKAARTNDVAAAMAPRLAMLPPLLLPLLLLSADVGLCLTLAATSRITPVRSLNWIDSAPAQAVESRTFCSLRRAQRCTSTCCSAAADFNEIGKLPFEPVPELGPAETIFVICAGLKYNNWPRLDAGIERLYHYLTPRGRVALAPTPPKSGLQGGVTLDYFLENAGSAALGSLLMCSHFKLVGDLTITPGAETRGRLATQMVEVINEPDDAMLTALVTAPRSHHEAILDAVRRGVPPPELPVPVTPVPRRAWYVFSLEEERRPPYQGCWLLKEMFPMQKTKLQILNEGGEEFDGPDVD